MVSKGNQNTSCTTSDDTAEALWPYHVAPLAAGVIVGIVTVIIVRRLRWHASSTYRSMGVPGEKAGQKAESAIRGRLTHVSKLCYHPPMTGSFLSANLSTENERRAQALDTIIPLKRSMLKWLTCDQQHVNCSLTMRSSLKDVVDLATQHDDQLFAECAVDCQVLCALSQRARFGHEEFTQALLDTVCAKFSVVNSRWQVNSERLTSFASQADDFTDGLLQSPWSPAAVHFSVHGVETSPLSARSLVTLETSI